MVRNNVLLWYEMTMVRNDQIRYKMTRYELPSNRVWVVIEIRKVRNIFLVGNNNNNICTKFGTNMDNCGNRNKYSVRKTNRYFWYDK